MISSKRVSEIIRDCLYKESEIKDGKPIINPIVVQGITRTLGLFPERVKKHEPEIVSMLKELPDTFSKGWTFLNLCYTKDNEQWTGLHDSCEELMLLGMAIDKISYCSPRDMWDILPGGMPYIVIKQ